MKSLKVNTCGTSDKGVHVIFQFILCLFFFSKHKNNKTLKHTIHSDDDEKHIL